MNIEFIAGCFTLYLAVCWILVESLNNRFDFYEEIDLIIFCLVALESKLRELSKKMKDSMPFLFLKFTL